MDDQKLLSPEQKTSEPNENVKFWSATAASKRFGEVIREVTHSKKVVAITAYKKVTAYMIDADEYEKFRQI